MTQYLNCRSWGTFPLQQLVEEVAQSLASSFSDRAIDTFIDIPANQMISADRTLLRRAVQNLMLNAIDAMPNGGSLVATSATTSSSVELEIADTGPTLSDEARHNIFYSAAGGNRGEAWYALEIVRRIAELHNGNILVANCPEGGVAFTLQIPRPVALEAAA
jgi:signal transduction histidine kinase